MKKIALFSLGGTISAEGKNRLDYKDYQSGKITGKQFLSHLPELEKIAHIEVVQMDNVSSTQINTSHWIRLKNSIEQYLNEKQFDGIVVTQGTSTLEETAFFIHLTVNSNKPIVFVGAQRPFHALSSDAPINLLHAFLVATSEHAKHKGVLVVANGEIHSARDVSKTNTYKLETFQSGLLGALGFVDVDHSVQLYRSPTRNHTTHSFFSKTFLNELPNVEIVYSYAGAKGYLIDSIYEQDNYKGIVIAGQGAGRFTKDEEQAITNALNNGLVVVQSSRGGEGRVVNISSYNHLNLVSGDNLSPQKARILLMLALTHTSDTNDIQQYFNEY